MNKQNPKRTRLIISEPQTDIKVRPTTRARSQLYRLIAQFRKESEKTDDARARVMFDFASEVMSGLALAFQHYEDHLKQDKNGKSP